MSEKAKHTPEEVLQLVKFAAFEHGRCCEYYQDGFGAFHCHGCGQATFSMLDNVQKMLGKEWGHSASHEEVIKSALVRRAAPELLEALETARDCLIGHTILPVILSAIAKAKEERPQ